LKHHEPPTLMALPTEALKLGQETLALSKATLGPDHPDTRASMFNLGLSQIQLKN
jgi:hypothetical protein